MRQQGSICLLPKRAICSKCVIPYSAGTFGGRRIENDPSNARGSTSQRVSTIRQQLFFLVEYLNVNSRKPDELLNDSLNGTIFETVIH